MNKELIDNEVFNIKKEMVIKDYDSLFGVYGRETNIVFVFRSLTITLLTGYYGFLLVSKLNYSLTLILSIPFFIIFMFLILEVAERSVMIKLLKELRNLESIFMEKNLVKLKIRLMDYEFRDIRDIKIKFKIRLNLFLKAFLLPQILSWYLFIILLNFLITSFIFCQNEMIKNISESIF